MEDVNVIDASVRDVSEEGVSVRDASVREVSEEDVNSVRRGGEELLET